MVASRRRDADAGDDWIRPQVIEEIVEVVRLIPQERVQQIVEIYQIIPQSVSSTDTLMCQQHLKRKIDILRPLRGQQSKHQQLLLSCLMFCVSVSVLSEHNISIPASSYGRCQSRRESDEHGHTTYGSGHEMVQIAVR